MLGQRRRRWPSIEPAQFEHHVFTAYLGMLLKEIHAGRKWKSLRITVLLIIFRTSNVLQTQASMLRLCLHWGPEFAPTDRRTDGRTDGNTSWIHNVSGRCHELLSQFLICSAMDEDDLNWETNLWNLQFLMKQLYFFLVLKPLDIVN